MALVSLQDIKVGFGGPLLLEGVDLSIDRGERVCLVGRNGTGKSTILRLITGEVKPDGGKIVFQQGVRITLLTQEVPHDLTGSVFDVVSGAPTDPQAPQLAPRARHRPLAALGGRPSAAATSSSRTAPR